MESSNGATALAAGVGEDAPVYDELGFLVPRELVPAYRSTEESLKIKYKKLALYWKSYMKKVRPDDTAPWPDRLELPPHKQTKRERERKKRKRGERDNVAGWSVQKNTQEKRLWTASSFDSLCSRESMPATAKTFATVSHITTNTNKEHSTHKQTTNNSCG